MSFAVSLRSASEAKDEAAVEVEWSSDSLRTLFAQRRNWWRADFHGRNRADDKSEGVSGARPVLGRVPPVVSAADGGVGVVGIDGRGAELSGRERVAFLPESRLSADPRPATMAHRQRPQPHLRRAGDYGAEWTSGDGDAAGQAARLVGPTGAAAVRLAVRGERGVCASRRYADAATAVHVERLEFCGLRRRHRRGQSAGDVLSEPPAELAGGHAGPLRDVESTDAAGTGQGAGALHHGASAVDAGGGAGATAAAH
eukprot:ctg_348.g262